MNSQQKIFGLCKWFPEHGTHLIAPNDLTHFIEIFPYGKVFEKTGASGDFYIVEYGESTFHVNKSIFIQIQNPVYEMGQIVKAKERNARVVGIEWHFGKGVPYYYLSFDEKRSSRRYFSHEILPNPNKLSQK